MKFYKPKFWDKQGFPNLISILLLPISLITIIKNYYENNKIKRNFYEFRTICVGNIYIGGTGKTPLVKNIACVPAKIRNLVKCQQRFGKFQTP